MEYGVLSMVLNSFPFYFFLLLPVFVPGSLLTGGHLPPPFAAYLWRKPLSTRIEGTSLPCFPILGNVSYRFFTSNVTISWDPVDKLCPRI
jgi:hypothetical protein